MLKTARLVTMPRKYPAVFAKFARLTPVQNTRAAQRNKHLWIQTISDKGPDRPVRTQQEKRNGSIR